MMILILSEQVNPALVQVKQFEYWREGEERIKLDELANEIFNINQAHEDDDDDDQRSPGEKVYQNDVVSQNK